MAPRRAHARLTERELFLDRRAFFVGDRVAWTQVAALLLSGAVASLLERASLAELFAAGGLYGCALLLGSALAWLLVPRARYALYYHHHWTAVAASMVVIWVSVTVYVGVSIDLWVGAYNAFWVSVAVAVMYASGYYLARWLRGLRRYRTGRQRLLIAAGVGATIATAGWLVGLDAFSTGLEACGQGESWTFGSAKQCRGAMIGLYVIVVGMGALMSAGLHALQLHLLFDADGLDVQEDAPNELIFKMLVGSMIITFVAWLLLLVLLPPLAGGGGGGGKRSRSSSSRKSRSRRARRGGGDFGAFAAYGLPSIEGEWAEVGLGEAVSAPSGEV